ncbi:SWIM zinc finger family protein [Paenibacillus crassostreae]|uniref:SWIM-type domain-containing protein n=1 Tax=Paenibacillus crassostreae TaxID=1763538 RepID=A0A167GAX2_9BACL|nr:hypothetical protein [Paenibacillus crassostreae]AOZ92630.1 hypothetical protein LPB68_10630 [Paenibacillus crassostreae]OAB77397.1 hypothetical protein PNBC_01620 [Paenibacillus crassostreae]
MNPTYIMDDTQWQNLIQNVAHNFNDLTIKRGFQYFKQGRVHSFTMSGPDHIEAVVEGTEDYSIKINIESFSANHCNCPVTANCKHIIAVLLEYANLQDRSVHALVNAHSAAMFKQVTKPSPHTAANRSIIQTPLQKAEASAKLKEQASHLSTKPISEWYELFEQCITPLGMKIPNGQYAQNALASIYTIKPQLSPVMELLFHLQVHLFVLKKLVKPLQKSENISNFYMGFHTQVAADDVLAEIERTFLNKLPLPTEPENWPYMKETLKGLRNDMLIEPQNLQYFLDVYNQLWSHWIYPNHIGSEMYLEELEHLQSAKDELGTSLSRLPWMLAQSWMHFYLTQDELSWALLKVGDKIYTIHPNHLYHFLSILMQTEEWARLTEWLIQIGPLLSSNRNSNLHQYWSYWETTIQYHPEAEQSMWATLVSMLPLSRNIYEEKLLNHGKWKQWMDYQLSTGREPLDYRVTVFQPVEKHAPELLLPFYHQAVERYVVQKNRDSYKLAVKLLKRLSKLYKKLKQEARWELFIASFVTRYSRLRALQEELRRGKLIS